MHTKNKTIVIKFGGAAAATTEAFAHIAELILNRKEHYKHVVVVVSAMQGVTDQLISLAKQVHPNPPQREYDMLLTCGERVSMSLLAMALNLKHCGAASLTGSQAGIITCKTHAEARIIEVRPHRIESLLIQGNVVIVAGFQGVSRTGEITTLGRGGSDTTAVALAIALKAECVEFYKDVAGIFSEDPKVCPEALFYEKLSYNEALSIASNGSKVLHGRAIALAKQNHIPLRVRGFQHEHLHTGKATLIESEENLFASILANYENDATLYDAGKAEHTQSVV